MAVGIRPEYEVIITIKEVHPAARPYAIKFYVPEVFAYSWTWRDVSLMAGFAKKVLANFSQVYLAATKHLR